MAFNQRWKIGVLTAALAGVLSLSGGAQQPQAAAVRKIGTVKSISGNTLVLKTDAGPEVNVSVSDSARIFKLAPGQTVKDAVPAEIKDIQAGDRILVSAAAEADPLTALRIVLMKQSDVAQKQQQDLQDWQKRGAGGIVSAIDAASGAITVAVTPTVNFVVKTSNSTVFLRYAPDSIKFSDAKKGSFADIKTGDQLRARGNRSADGKEVAAEEVISGSFRNIAGTVTAIDAGNNSITVKDILAKKSVVVKISGDTQMRKLPPPLAQRIAAVLKGTPGGGGQSPDGGSGAGSAPAAGGASATGNGATAGSGGGPRGPGRGMDFQQMIGRLPAVTVSDLQKEDAVMIVSTNGSGSEVAAITLLSGVEPILTASPNGMSAAALLSGWNLSAPGGGEGPQ
ncbi:MAG TPA: hypothetical protein VKW06_19490 [Candidatus Angelobacter sp.]|nr:hypothetical protein [Candidatus Angelobacter sp.]